MGARRRRGGRAALHADGRRSAGSPRAASTTARVWELLGVEQPASTWAAERLLSPTRCRASSELRRSGLRVGAVGNTPAEAEELLREHVDFVGSSARWGVEKPAPAFFERIVAEAAARPARDRVRRRPGRQRRRPALAAGMVAVHVRRGPWGHLHEPPPAALRIRSLAELPEALGV